MPWTPEESTAKTKHADTPAKQRRWSAIANHVLAQTGGDEGKAIAVASGVLKRGKKKKE